MCGRFTLTTPTQIVAEMFSIASDDAAALAPRYNIAPSQPVAVVRDRSNGPRELVLLRWGLVPPWAKDPSIGNRMINARGETVAEKPSYRSPFQQRRCLIIADGFYEWATRGSGRPRQAFLIGRRDRRAFAMAGLWERWRPPSGRTVRDDAHIETCTIITTAANELMGPIHARMPAIIATSDYDRWLDCSSYDRSTLEDLLRPWSCDDLDATAVSSHVNSPTNDDPRCLEPTPPIDPA